MTCVTVFTPTYNRAHRLPHLYESLKNQSDTRFEWLIVDDGSTDTTELLISDWICSETAFPIRYYKKQNGGKHTAINYGVPLARGELFFIVDSDDSITPNAIKRLFQWEQAVHDLEKCAGVSGLCMSKSGQLIGATFPYDYCDATNLQRQTANIIGDKSEAYYTHILKQYPFPVFQGEHFMTEDVVWDRIAHDGYFIRWYNEPIYIRDYMEDGLTHQGRALFAKNPNGYALSVRQKMSFLAYSTKAKILAAFYFYTDVKDVMNIRSAIRMLDLPYYYIAPVLCQFAKVKIKNFISN